MGLESSVVPKAARYYGAVCTQLSCLHLQTQPLRIAYSCVEEPSGFACAPLHLLRLNARLLSVRGPQPVHRSLARARLLPQSPLCVAAGGRPSRPALPTCGGSARPTISVHSCSSQPSDGRRKVVAKRTHASAATAALPATLRQPDPSESGESLISFAARVRASGDRVDNPSRHGLRDPSPRRPRLPRRRHPPCRVGPHPCGSAGVVAASTRTSTPSGPELLMGGKSP